MHPLAARTRRHFFRDCGVGLAPIAAAMLAGRARGAGASHRPATAKRIIYLFQAGAPSQLELFDYKPKLKEMAGEPMPKSVTDGLRLAFIQPDAGVLAPQFDFARHGQSGAELSSAIPHLASVADELAVVKTVHTDQFNHAPAQLLMNTGHNLPGRPSLGSWLSYGLGSEADDLPAFVVLTGPGNLSGGAAMWGSGVLPGSHQGSPVPQHRRPDPARRRPPGRGPAGAAGQPRPHRRTERAPQTGRRRPGDRRAPRRLRDGLPHAGRRPRTDGPLRRDGRDDGVIRRRPGRRRQAVRQQLPARPPDGRAGRAVRAGLSRGLGPPLGREGRRREARQDRRPSQRRPHQGPQAAGIVGRHARHLGRGVRPHADGRDQRRAGPRRRPRSPPGVLLGPAGRRRHQAGRDVRRDGRVGVHDHEGPGARPRPARHAAAVFGRRSRAAGGEVPGPSSRDQGLQAFDRLPLRPPRPVAQAVPLGHFGSDRGSD